MAMDLSFGASPAYGIDGDAYGVAQWIGADNSYTTGRTSDTVTMNAIDGAAPIDNTAGGGWGDFWKGTLQTVIGYSIAKDAAQSGVGTPRNTAGGQLVTQTAAPPASRGMTLLFIAGAAVLVFMAAKD